MQAKVLRTLITASGPHFIHSDASTRGKTRDRANRGTVAACANQFQDNPVMGGEGFVHHQGWMRPCIQHHNVHPAIVVEIAENRTPAAFGHLERFSALGGNVGVASGAPLKQQVALLVAAAAVVLLDGILQVAGGNEYLPHAIQIEIGPSTPPRSPEAGAGPDARCNCDILEEKIPSDDAEVAVERVDLVLVVRDDDIESAVAVIVPGIRAHGPLFIAILVIGHSRQDADFLESAVATITKEKIFLDVVAHIDIRPAVAIEIRTDDSHGVAFVPADPGGLAHIVKGAVSLVVEEAAPSGA